MLIKLVPYVVFLSGSFLHAIFAAIPSLHHLEVLSTRSTAVLDELCPSGDRLSLEAAPSLQSDLVELHEYAQRVLNNPPADYEWESVSACFKQVTSLLTSTKGVFESCMGKRSLLEMSLGDALDSLLDKNNLVLSLNYDTAVDYLASATVVWSTEQLALLGRFELPVQGDDDVQAYNQILQDYIVKSIPEYSFEFSDMFDAFLKAFDQVHYAPQRISFFDKISKELDSEAIMALIARILPNVELTVLKNTPEIMNLIVESLKTLQHLYQVIIDEKANHLCQLKWDDIQAAILYINQEFVRFSKYPNQPLSDQEKEALRVNFETLSAALDLMDPAVGKLDEAHALVYLERLNAFFRLDRSLIESYFKMEQNRSISDTLNPRLVAISEKIEKYIDHLAARFKKLLASDLALKIATEDLFEGDQDTPEIMEAYLANNAAKNSFHLWRLYQSLTNTMPYLDSTKLSSKVTSIITETFDQEHPGNVVNRVQRLLPIVANRQQRDQEQWNGIPALFSAYAKSWKQLDNSLQGMYNDKEEKLIAQAFANLTNQLTKRCIQNIPTNVPYLESHLRTLVASLKKLLGAQTGRMDSSMFEFAKVFKRFVPIGYILASSCKDEIWEPSTLAVTRDFNAALDAGWEVSSSALNSWLQAYVQSKDIINQNVAAEVAQKLVEFEKSVEASKSFAFVTLYNKLKQSSDDDEESYCAKKIALSLSKKLNLKDLIADIEGRIVKLNVHYGTINEQEGLPVVEFIAMRDAITAYRRLSNDILQVLTETVPLLPAVEDQPPPKENTWMFRLLFVAIALTVLAVGFSAYMILKSSESSF